MFGLEKIYRKYTKHRIIIQKSFSSSMVFAPIKRNCTRKLARVDTVDIEKFQHQDKILSDLVHQGRIIIKYLNIVVG